MQANTNLANRVISNRNYFVNRNGMTPRWVILHSTAGGVGADAIARYFQSVQVSSHYVIGQDGTIIQCVLENDGAWANGVLTTGHDFWWTPAINPNNVTISIEHVKPSTDNSDELTADQQESSFRLIKDICQRWNIPMRLADGSGGIAGHFSLDPVNRSRCPGPYPWDQLWAYLNGCSAIEQAARDTWDSTAHLFGGSPLPYDTGIAASWQNLYVEQKKNMPPPTTREFPSVDWSGKSITVQFFGTIRCEWDSSGQAHWYKTGL